MYVDSTGLQIYVPVFQNTMVRVLTQNVTKFLLIPFI